MKVNIYLASSIKSPRKQNGAIEYILQAGDTDKTMTQFEFLQDVTANQSDVLCLKAALSRINDKADIVLIHTDSNYMNLSLAALKQNQRFLDFVKTGRGKERQFIGEWQEIYTRLATRQWDFLYKQPNEFKRWLFDDCIKRAKEHYFA